MSELNETATAARGSGKTDKRVEPINQFLQAMGVTVANESTSEQAPTPKRTVIELKLEGDMVKDPITRYQLRKNFAQIAKQAGVEATIERVRKNSKEVIAHVYLNS